MPNRKLLQLNLHRGVTIAMNRSSPAAVWHADETAQELAKLRSDETGLTHEQSLKSNTQEVLLGVFGYILLKGSLFVAAFGFSAEIPHLFPRILLGIVATGLLLMFDDLVRPLIKMWAVPAIDD